MWVPPEDKDPIVYHHPTRRSVGYFGAVRLSDGTLLFRRETGKFNGESFWNFLKVANQRRGPIAVLYLLATSPIPSLPIASGLAAPASAPVWIGFLATLQPRTES